MNIRRTLVSLLSTIVVTLTMLGIVLINAQTSDEEPDLSYRTLDYDVAVQRNGDLKVTQHIDMRLKDRGRDWKQMYQRYTLKSKNLTDISDIGVKDVSNGETYRQGDFVFPDNADNWNDEHAGRWYIVDVTEDENDPQPFNPQTDGLSDDGQADKTLEIGWNIPQTVSEDSLKFDVSMTLHGVSTAYDDVVSFQWEPFGEENQIPIGTVTGKVTFPNGINGKNSWAWLHTKNTSTTNRGDNGSLMFSANDVRAGDYLDVVAMFDASQAQGVARTKSGAYKQRLIDDETKQEREWRSSQHTKAVKRVAGWIFAALIGIALAVAALYFAIVSFRKSQYKGDIEYWRDLPDLSPAAAAKMEDIMSASSSIFGSGKTKNADKLANRQMSATVMSLASKGAIAIYPGPVDLYNDIDLTTTSAASVAGMLGSNAASARKLKKTSTIAIMPVVCDDIGSLLLSSSERAVLDILLKASSRLHDAQVFDMKQMSKAFKHYSSGYKLLETFDNACSTEFDDLHAVKPMGLLSYLFSGLGIAFAFFLALKYVQDGELAVALVVCVPVVALCAFAAAYGKRYVLTDEGQRYGGQVAGLKRYLTDFSDFTDRGVLDMTLWGRYMVYATAFGISKKAMAQLARAYPEVADPQWLDEHAGTSYMYMPLRSSSLLGASVGTSLGASTIDPAAFSANFGDLGAQLSSSFADVRSTISAAAPSSSSGGSGSFGGSGGSFSGGGFGGSSGGSGGGSFGGR